MSSELLLGVRLNDALTQEKYTLPNVDLSAKVDHLRQSTAHQLGVPIDSFELVYCGCVLEDGASLVSYGVKSGVMVHVIKKGTPEEAKRVKIFTEPAIQAIVTLFGAFSGSNGLRSIFYRLIKRPDVMENIMSSLPGLSEDPVVVAILLDPNLLIHFSDVDTVRRIVRIHPLLMEGARLMMIAARAEVLTNRLSTATPSALNATSNTFSSFDGMSDDDEMAGDSSHSSDSAQPNSASGITSAHLAAALSGVSGAQSNPLSASSSSSNLGSGNNAANVITAEMFTQAMQQAISSAPISRAPRRRPAYATAITGGVPLFTEPQPALSIRDQLERMHEMGLQDDAVNTQALQYTNGNLQAAIELVFNGWTANNN